MSKQKNDNEVTKIYEIIINKKETNLNLFEIVRNNIKNKNDEVYIVNEIIKKLNNNGYTLENINPLKIKEI